MQFPVILHRLNQAPAEVGYHCQTITLGTLLTAWVNFGEQTGLCGLFLIDDPSQALPALHSQWPSATFTLLQETPSDLPRQSFYKGNHVTFESLPVAVYGSDFQIVVWEALLTIPFATTCTYQDIAKQINNVKAVQAVGTAIGANPIANLIPCHRVIRQDGELGGYRWGLDRKQILLEWENNYL